MSERRCEARKAPLQGKQAKFCGWRCNRRAQAAREAGKIRAALAGGPEAMAALLQERLASLEREAQGVPGRRGRPPGQAAEGGHFFCCLFL